MLLSLTKLFSTTTETFDIYYAITFLAVLLIAGMILGKLAEKIGIPAVTGYILAGILAGPVFHLVNDTTIQGLNILSDISIGFIAYQIGIELWLPKYKKSGKRILIITIFQAVFTFLIVCLLLLVFKRPLWMALTLGAIACATAPAPIMMIIKRYRVKGEVADTLVPVTGLDDGVGIIIFGICLSVSAAILNNNGHVNFATAILDPLKEIGLSILFGMALGLIIVVANKFVFRKYGKHERNDAYLSVAICVVFLSVAGSRFLGLSPILTPMVAGACFTNFVNKDTFKVQQKTVDKFVPPLMIVFFTLAGAELDLKVLISAGLVGVIYVLGRALGKFLGAFLGAKIAKASKNVQRYLGLALLPQGGVAIGMVLSCVSAFGSKEGVFIQTVVLAGIFIFELIGPVLVKLSFKKSNEINADDSIPVPENGELVLETNTPNNVTEVKETEVESKPVEETPPEEETKKPEETNTSEENNKESDK